MADLNELRKVGFSKKQSIALSQLGGGSGGSLASLPPYQPVPAGSKVFEFVPGETLGRSDWDWWFGGDQNSSGHVLGAFTAIRSETVTLPGPVWTPGHEGAWETSSVLAVAPLDLPSSDWISSGDVAARTATYQPPGQEAQFALTAGRTYVVLLFEYDTTSAGHTIRIDYTDFWNVFAAHMLPPGEMCTVFDTGSELYLIPDPLVVRPAPQSIRTVMLTDTITFGAVNLDGYRSKDTGNQLSDGGGQLASVGASWNATDDRYDLSGLQQWTLHIKLGFTSWTTQPNSTHWAKVIVSDGEIGSDHNDFAFTVDGTRRESYSGTVFFAGYPHMKFLFSTNHPDAQLNVQVQAQVVS